MRFLSFVAALAVLGSGLPAMAAGNPVMGKKVYETNCQVCHGPDGRSVINGTPNFIRGERMEKPDPVLLATMRNGLNMMPAWKGVITDREMEDALAYARTLRR